LAQSTLTVSNFAMQSTSDRDVVYNNLESKIASWTIQRDALACAEQNHAGGSGVSADWRYNEQQAKQLISASETLLNQGEVPARRIREVAGARSV